eukprot:6186334-Pleurochrysis_carterae.AAC.2
MAQRVRENGLSRSWDRQRLPVPRATTAFLRFRRLCITLGGRGLDACSLLTTLRAGCCAIRLETASRRQSVSVAARASAPETQSRRNVRRRRGDWPLAARSAQKTKKRPQAHL